MIITWNSRTSSRKNLYAFWASSSFSNVTYHELLCANSHDINLGHPFPENKAWKKNNTNY